jgi:hypothetical protein
MPLCAMFALRLGYSPWTSRMEIHPSYVCLWHIASFRSDAPRVLTEWCDDEGVPLICPTCQVWLQSPYQRLPATLHGVVFDIFGWERDPPAQTSLRSGLPLSQPSMPSTIWA